MRMSWPIAGGIAMFVIATANAQTPTSSEIIEAARDAYASEVYAEILTFEVTDGTGRTERSTIRVHVQPMQSGDDVAQVLLDLGRLRLWASAGEMIATHRGSDGSADHGWWDARAPEAGAIQILESHTPPIAIPSVQILRGSGGLTPLAPRIDWNGVVEDPAGRGWLLAGRIVDAAAGGASERAVQATFDRTSKRLVRVIVSGPGTSGLQRLTITAAQTDAGDPASWRPMTDPAFRRSSLAEIAAGRPRLVPGDSFPPVVWVNADGGAWRLLSTENGSGSAAARSTVLVLWRASSDAGARASAVADVRACAEAVAARIRYKRSEAIRGGAARANMPRMVCSAVFAIDDFDAEAFAAMAGELSDLLTDEPGVVWTSPANATIDAMAADAVALLCVVDAEGALRTVLVIDGMGAMPDGLTPDVERAVDAAIEAMPRRE